MSNQHKYITTIHLTIEHEKPLDDVTDKVAGRVYTLDGVRNTTAKLLSFTALSDPNDDFEPDDVEDSIEND
jgi:hypothetical protein